MPRTTRHLSRLGALAAALAALAGCGEDEAAAPDSPRAADTSFPPTEGRTLEEMKRLGQPGDDLVISPAGQVFDRGENRFGFGVFSVDGSQIDDADVAIYTARHPSAEAHGPFPATVHSLETPPAYRAESTSADPDSAEVVYVSEIEVPSRDKLWMAALVATDDGFVVSNLPTADPNRFPKVPDEGEKAPRIHTPTADDVGGDISQIDTRNPPSTQHEDDLADVLGTKPVVLLFATPALCQSRVCGPVVDIAEQVKDETDADVSFIHMEIFEDNEFSKGPRPQVLAYGLPTEPWLFVIDDRGRVSAAIEGAFGADELREAVAEVT